MTTFATPANYNDYLVKNLTKISLEDYFKTYHTQFYPDQDISFMPYFLELRKHKHDYCVPHTKLFEYGIMSEGSDAYTIKTRLDKLKLKNHKHFTLQKVLERNQNGIGANTKHMYIDGQVKDCYWKYSKNDSILELCELGRGRKSILIIISPL